MSKILKSIFEVRNEGYKKRLTILGMNFRFSAMSKSREIYLQTRLANAVFNLHSHTFPKYKGVNKGKDIVIVATGPSLSKYKPIEGAIHIGLNGAIEQNIADLDCLFVQDFTGKNSERAKAFVSYRAGVCEKFFGIVPYFEKSNIPEHIVAEAGAKQYYATEEGFNLDISTSELPALGSVAFAALSFALWTQPKRIYLVGCDCTHGYFNATPNLSRALKFSLKGWFDFKKFALIHYPDVEIISLNPVGLKGLFTDIDQ